MQMDIPFILASSSPRRIEFLSFLKETFVSSPADMDETPQQGELPVAYCRRMAREKGLRVMSHQTDACILLSADTIVYQNNRIDGKPVDADHAAAMLTALQGCEHHVLTSTVLFVREGNYMRVWQADCDTIVHMRSLSPDEIRAYIATGDPFGKAGGYAIQNQTFHLIDRIDGCFASVAGFAACHTAALFQAAGHPYHTDFQERCKRTLALNCPHFFQTFARDVVITTHQWEL